MDWTIEQTVTCFASDLGTLSVVRCIGGEYAMAIDGEPIKALYWHAGQLEECVAAAQRMARYYSAKMDGPPKPSAEGTG